MSLILDALRQSKQQVGPPGADDTLPAASTATASKRPAGVVGIVAGVMLGVALVMLWQWGFDRGSDSAQVGPVSVDPRRTEVASARMDATSARVGRSRSRLVLRDRGRLRKRAQPIMIFRHSLLTARDDT